MTVLRQHRCHQRLNFVTDCDCSAYNYFKTIESKVGSRIFAELGIDIPGDIRTIKVCLISYQIQCIQHLFGRVEKYPQYGTPQGWAIILKKILFKEDWFCEDKS